MARKIPNGWNLGKIVGILNPNKTNIQRSNMIHQFLTRFLIDLINPVLWLAGNMIVKDPGVGRCTPMDAESFLNHSHDSQTGYWCNEAISFDS